MCDTSLAIIALPSQKRRHDTRPNDTRPNDTRPNANALALLGKMTLNINVTMTLNNTHHNDTVLNVTQHKDAWHNDTQHNDAEDKDIVA